MNFIIPQTGTTTNVDELRRIESRLALSDDASGFGGLSVCRVIDFIKTGDKAYRYDAKDKATSAATAAIKLLGFERSVLGAVSVEERGGYDFTAEEVSR